MTTFPASHAATLLAEVLRENGQIALANSAQAIAHKASQTEHALRAAEAKLADYDAQALAKADIIHRAIARERGRRWVADARARRVQVIAQ